MSKRREISYFVNRGFIDKNGNIKEGIVVETHVVEYFFNGKRYQEKIYATSKEEAQKYLEERYKTSVMNLTERGGFINKLHELFQE